MGQVYNGMVYMSNDEKKREVGIREENITMHCNET